MFNTKIVGILNITPDSFSDGGKFFTPDAAITRIKALVEEGADVIDIGAESTRPGAEPLTPDEEWQRLEPVIELLTSFTSTHFSVDTRHAATVRKILPYGIGYINDVSGFSDAAMIEAVRESDCKLVIMHSLSVPADKNIVIPESEDVVKIVLRFAESRIASLKKSGISKDRIVFDPGIGFGKTMKQSMTIVQEISRFKALGVPIYMGHSRKSFLFSYHDNHDISTLAVSQYMIAKEIDYMRVHDVNSHKKIMKLMNVMYHDWRN